MYRYALSLLVLVSACRGSDAHSTKSETASRGTPTSTSVAAVAVSQPATSPPQLKCPAPLPAVVVPCDKPKKSAHTTTGKDKLSLVSARFANLPGWKSDKQAVAAVAFARSCAQLATLADDAPVGSGPYGGTASDWRAACTAVAALPAGDNKAARRFFEKQFKAYAAHGRKGPEGKLTGYYVQPLRGSRTRRGPYQFPLMAVPKDLVSVQLSNFISDGRSRRIWGRVDPATMTFVPYPTREEIRKGNVGNEGVVVWVDDPVDAMAVEIEGSGKAVLEDGTVLWVAFGGKNGRRGRRLRGTMRAIRALKKNFDAENAAGMPNDSQTNRFHEVVDPKKSVVFFELESRPGAIGTQDVVLTPQRSLAVDRAVIPLSTPVWVDTVAPRSPRGKQGTWQRLLIAQDTGGAILGSVRGDIYWGDDEDAVRMGSRTYGKGQMWLLLPRALKVKTKVLPKKPAPAASKPPIPE